MSCCDSCESPPPWDRLVGGTLGVDGQEIPVPASIAHYFYDADPEHPTVLYGAPRIFVTREEAFDVPYAFYEILRRKDLRDLLCAYCADGANLGVSVSDRIITRALCARCRVVLGRHAPCPCPDGFRGCLGWRYVDPVGTPAELCAACHDVAKGGRKRAALLRGFGGVPCGAPDAAGPPPPPVVDAPQAWPSLKQQRRSRGGRRAARRAPARD